MLNHIQYTIAALTAFVFRRCNMELKAPVQVYQTTLYKSTVAAALRCGLRKEQYATWLLKAQREHIRKGRKMYWCEDTVQKAIHWRTTGKAHLWQKIHQSM